jgi:hypothetical protein
MREHQTESVECWCHPEVRQPCPVCGDEVRKDCFECHGSGVVLAYDPSLPRIVKHFDMED